jgi:hypothetical protein
VPAISFPLNVTPAPAVLQNWETLHSSYRVNLMPGYWVPAYVYSQEGDDSYGSKNKIAFKAQTRLWGYDLQTREGTSEFTA